MTRLWFDVSAAHGWHRPPSGIIRVELECLRLALQLPVGQVGFCVFDGAMECWYEMPAEVAARLLDRAHRQADAAPEPTWQPRSSPLRFQPGDGYVCLSADQTLARFVALYQARSQLGLRVFGMVYDLIPILFPHFYWNQADQSCARFMVDLVTVCEHLFCISQATRRDLMAFCQDVGIAPPPVSVVRLGDALAAPSGAVSDSVCELARQPFVLVVGTVEIRKNHETLYRAVLDVLARGQAEPPRLVFAGMRGWRVDDLLLSLELDPRVRGRIVHLPHATDADLQYLYQHCLGTAFPSQYEGWGLPVAESLAHGKPCLVARNSAMPEIAAESLLTFLDTFDVRGWADALVRLGGDAAWRQQQEQRIRAQYRVTAWAEPARQVLQHSLAALRRGGGPVQ